MAELRSLYVLISISDRNGKQCVYTFAPLRMWEDQMPLDSV
jgi:hypothetical protein